MSEPPREFDSAQRHISDCHETINKLNTECGHLQVDLAELKAINAELLAALEEIADETKHVLHQKVARAAIEKAKQ